MKELSIEEKARLYDEAKLRMSAAYNSNRCTIGFMNEIFPELAESEDERIRKALIKYFTLSDEHAYYKACGVSYRDIVAWLEKQGEQKHINLVTILDDYFANTPKEQQDKDWEELKHLNNFGWVLVEQKPVNDVEPTPIFRIGDTLKKKGKDYTFIVDRIQGGYYHCDRNHGAFFPIEEQDNWELVEQKPIEEVNGEDYGIDGLWHAVRILETTLGEVEGYQSDDGILEHKAAITVVKQLKEQNPAWSEEDENQLINTIELVKNANDCAGILDKETALNWLKSLKDRVQSKPQQEWSDKDEKMIHHIENSIKYDKSRTYLNSKGIEIIDVCNWLKSLRPQNTWKPSEEQMNALKHASNFCSIAFADIEILATLYEQLKSL